MYSEALNGLISQFVYPFTFEPHILTLESSRTATLAAHSAKHESCFRHREEIKQKRQRDALHRVAPGFEPQSAPLVPTKVSDTSHGNDLLTGGQVGGFVTGESGGSNTIGVGFGHQRNVMDDLVDHLAALDAASATPADRPPVN